MAKVLRLEDEQFEALKEVLDYLREDEKKDFEEYEEAPENHIYKSIKLVDAALPQQ